MSDVTLAQTCILAGCDFVKGLPGIGMKKAHIHMKRLRSFLKVSPPPLIVTMEYRDFQSTGHARTSRKCKKGHLNFDPGHELPSKVFVPRQRRYKAPIRHVIAG